jgi:hypothetical protein
MKNKKTAEVGDFVQTETTQKQKEVKNKKKVHGHIKKRNAPNLTRFHLLTIKL